MCFASNTDLELWTEEVEQGVIDNMIIFQKPSPGAARAELESQLQRAVKVSAKGKHVKCKMDLERCLFWDPAGNRVPRPAEFAGPRACGQWGVLFEVRHLMLEPQAASSSLELVAFEPTHRWRSVRWQNSRSRRTRVSPWQLE